MTGRSGENYGQPPKFRLFPSERSNLDYPWQVWALGLAAVFKSILWIAYGTRYGWPIPDWAVGSMQVRFFVMTIPFFVLGVGIWNFRKWAVRLLPLAAGIDLALSLLLLILYPRFYFFSDEVMYGNVLFSAIAQIVSLVLSFRDIILNVAILALCFPVSRIIREAGRRRQPDR